MFQLGPVVKNLLGLNIIIWLGVVLLLASGASAGVDLIYKYGALQYWTEPGFNPAQYFTYQFLHAYYDKETHSIVFNHVLFNMFGLFMFGRYLEAQIGSKRFLLLYIIGGVVAAFVQQFMILALGEDPASLVGASGAVAAIVIGFAVMNPNMQVMLLIPPIPMKMKYMAIGYVVIEFYQEMNRTEGDNVAHWAHLGGALAGFLIIRYWKNK